MKKEIPRIVRAAFNELKREYKFFTVLRQANGHYYVYRQTARWDKDAKKVKSKQEYIGKIEADGTFVKKSTSAEIDFEMAKKIVEEHGGEISFSGKPGQKPSAPNELQPDLVDTKILTTLSMNARASMSFMGRRIGLSQNAIYNRIGQLEKRYGIRYMAEIDVERLGYLPFLITVKFLGPIPSREEIIKALKKDPRVQLAFTTKGDYDLVIYALSKSINSEETIDIVVSLRTGALIKYPAKWYTSTFWKHASGYIPLRDEFVDSLKGNLLKREYAVLKELNSNGKSDFTEIDKKYGFDKGRSQYTYYKLKESGVIKRITLSMQRVPIKYIGIILKEIIDEDKFRKNRVKSLLDIVQDSPLPVNKYILTGDYGNPDGSVLFMPVQNDGDLEANIENLAGLDLGLNFRTLIVTGILLGSFCLRKFDQAYATQYKPLEEQYHITRPEVIDYEASGRRKTASAKKGKEFIIEPQTDKYTEDLEEDD
ncbi:MAG: AsnC family transcriptional regulator [Candidatus Micrarchaeales archaeon]|nr:AsnC family transcriptional regulator [Candidatus Micrarchaeales archaeon]